MTRTADTESTPAAPPRHAPRNSQLPPVILLGGTDNALSLTRRFGRRGIPVYVINKPHSDVCRSRYAQSVTLDVEQPFERAAIEWLLGPASDTLQGSVLLAASDEGLVLLAEQRESLRRRYLLDLSNPVAQSLMLDKAATYEAARLAGVPTPKFWQARTLADVEALRRELCYPLLVKPKLSHLFQQRFSRKFLVAQDFEELVAAFQVTDAAGIDVLLVELVPGPDSALCSYYTWLDEDGNAAFDFTKRIIRRYPVNMGLATYHITDHVPGVKDLALKLFRQVGLQGLANAEFKLDPRDGQLKLIECNARFTAANELVARAGIDLGALVYNRLVGLPPPPVESFQDGLTLWDPLRDWKAFRELRQRGELTLFGWIRSVLRRQTFPVFNWSDPIPALARVLRHVRKPADQKKDPRP